MSTALRWTFGFAIFAAIIAAWIVAPRRSSDAAVLEPKPSPVRATSGEIRAPAEAPLELARDVESPLPSARDAEVESGSSEAEASTGAPFALIRVRVVAKEDRAPLEAVRVMPFPTSGTSPVHDVPGVRGRIGEAPFTGSDGVAELEVEPHRAWKVCVSGAGHPFEQQVVGELAADEVREIEFVLATRDDVHLFGQIVDEASGSPLAGSVRFVRGPRPRDEMPTRPDGTFELEGASWERAFASATSPGYAPRVFPVTEGFGAPAHPLVVELARSATLELKVRDRSAMPVAGAQIEITTQAHELQLRTSTFRDYYSDRDPTWHAATGADGRATIADLPPGAPLHVSVSSDGGAKHVSPDPIGLAPGEQRELEIALGGGATVIGRLEDERGAPIAGRLVWRVAEPAWHGALFEPSDDAAERTVSDASGRFQFDDVPEGDWRIGPAPPNLRDNVPEDDVAPIAQRVHVSEGIARIEIVVRAERGLYLRGRVLRPSGEPIAGTVIAWQADRETSGIDESSDDGSFSIGPLCAGNWKIAAEAFDSGFAVSDPLDVRAGEADIVLRLKSGASIAGEVVDASSGARRACEVSFLRTDGDHADGCVATSDDGAFRANALDAGTYAVVARTRDGLVGVTPGIEVRAGASVGAVRVAVSPGATLELEYEGPAKLVFCRVFSGGVPVARSAIELKNSTDVVVPPGAIEVRWSDGSPLELTRSIGASVGPGEHKKLVLRRDD